MKTQDSENGLSNPYCSMDWKSMLKKYGENRTFRIDDYRKILSPEFPDFLLDYIKTPAMQRLSGAGLLCGTDWTPLYKNRFYYSRLDHSIGAALIIFNFTHDKVQTLAGLFHDISTPAFSHVMDFKNGDRLTQTSTEGLTEEMIRSSSEICVLLQRDGISVEEIADYHKYPVADNDIPRLSADRLEYMFPSGAALQGSWSLEEIKRIYKDICVLKNEYGCDELGFCSLDCAELYTRKFLETGHILQLNENKLTLELLAQIISCAEKLELIRQTDFYMLSESEIIRRFDDALNCKQKDFNEFRILHRTFREMTEIIHSAEPIQGCFCVNIDVKQRWINPLVCTAKDVPPRRIADISDDTARLIKSFLEYKDTPYGCVKLSDSDLQL
ncbi:MAG: hypothetical protein ACFNKL_01565 [Treponema sp.]